MAHFTLNQYLQQVEDALCNQDGPKSADLLSFKHPHVASPRLQLENPESSVERVVSPPFDEVVASHIRCIWAVNNHDFLEAYKCQVNAMQSFNKIFQLQKEENWALPILFTLTLDLRLFAGSADKQKDKGAPGEMLEKTAELLMGSFRVCASDSRASQDDSKKWGMLYLVNQLFKIYFKINKLHLCKPLIRAIESSNLKEQFSKAQLVTYRYYVGRKSMFDSDFKSAEEYLTYAFQHCLRQCKRNKRLILIYLIPVKMLLGQMPALSLLKKYDLMQFAGVVKSVKQGNLLQLNEALAENETFFIKCGIYLILEKLRVITYRNLFKKVYLLLGSFRIPISAFLAALKFMQMDDVDSDEVQCIVANLIYENKIKGYISLQHQMLVVSKQNAFPALSSIT